jgi:acyl-coenzyme A synthetase/AMP-(fatty) acid ligase
MSDLFQATATTLAAFKRPQRTHFVAEIPKSLMGKVQRRVLEERHAPAEAPQR